MEGGPAVWDRPQDGCQDTGAFGPAGLSAPPAAEAPEAGPIHGYHRAYSGGGLDGSSQAAAHGEADLRMSSRRAWLLWRTDHRQGLRSRTAPSLPGDVRAAGAFSRPCSGGLWRGGCVHRRGEASGAFLRHDASGMKFIRKKFTMFWIYGT